MPFGPQHRTEGLHETVKGGGEQAGGSGYSGARVPGRLTDPVRGLEYFRHHDDSHRMLCHGPKSQRAEVLPHSVPVTGLAGDGVVSCNGNGLSLRRIAYG